MKKLFCVNANKYDSSQNFEVYWPASLDNPRDNAVMFVNRVNIHRLDKLNEVNKCIVYYPIEVEIPDNLKSKNIVLIGVEDPRVSYCLFYKENNIRFLPPFEKMKEVSGALIAETASIGDNTTIMPFAYIGGEVSIGEGCYIGAGTKLVGRIEIGNNVVIRENTVIGADGLSTDRDKDGRAATMPQFGGVVIEDDVMIGANTVIARGAIDNTVIKRGSKIDNSSFISHNVVVGEDTFIVGETIMFGGSSTGKGVFLSGNTTVRNKVSVGDKATVGMGSTVTKNVEPGATVFGNPAHKGK